MANNGKTCVCPTCGRRVPEAVYGPTDSDVQGLAFVTAPFFLIGWGLIGFLVSLGVSMLIFLGLMTALRWRKERHLAKVHARFNTEMKAPVLDMEVITPDKAFRPAKPRKERNL